MTPRHPWTKPLAPFAWVALLAWSALSPGCGKIVPIEPADASLPPLPPDAARIDAGTGGPIDAGPAIDAGPPADASLACVEEDLGSQLGSPVYFGDTTGELDNLTTCDGEPGYGDVHLLWTAPATGRYVFHTCGSQFDTILSARTADCSGTELKCNDDDEAEDFCGGPESLASRMVLDLDAGERILLVVDGYDEEGEFLLTIAQQ